MKVFDSERKVLEVVWAEGRASAKHIAEVLAAQHGWSKTTTYTVLKKCVEKGAIAREDPGFYCTPLVSQSDVRLAETDALINKYFEGSADKLVASILNTRRLTPDKISGLKRLIEELE